MFLHIHYDHNEVITSLGLRRKCTSTHVPVQHLCASCGLTHTEAVTLVWAGGKSSLELYNT